MEALFNDFRAYIAKNSQLEPVFEKIPVDSMPVHKWVGGIIADGTLYGVINSAPSMLALDIETKQARLIGNFDEAPFKWSGACQIEDRLYLFPRAARGLLCYEPARGSFREYPSRRCYGGEHHYGGVWAAGKIWQPPRNTDHLLIWEPDGACTELQVADHPVHYCGSVLHPNGCVYFLPERNEPVLCLEPQNGTVTPLTPPVSTMVFDAKVAADGCIYGYSSASGLMRLDVRAGVCEMLYPEIPFRAYGTKFGANGRLYSLPGWNGALWEFTLQKGTLRQVYTCDGTAEVHFAGGACDANGNIFAVPVFEDYVLKIDFGGEKIPPVLHEVFFKDNY